MVSGPIVGPVFEDRTVASGNNFTCALKSDSTIECWGLNDNGQTDTPSGLTDVTQISA
ncbi:hypothetical protein H6769_02320 [Candidatus Peribacteria bacterium]|nr:hypothetical protein [Candidatus Peribacteria bacterium]